MLKFVSLMKYRVGGARGGGGGGGREKNRWKIRKKRRTRREGSRNFLLCFLSDVSAIMYVGIHSDKMF